MLTRVFRLRGLKKAAVAWPPPLFGHALRYVSGKVLAFVCTSCGHDSPKWGGRCGSCGEWNTMKEFKESPVADHASARNIRPASFSPALSAAPKTGAVAGKPSTAAQSWLARPAAASAAQLTPLRSVGALTVKRVPTGSAEIDRLLGGGLAPGSVTLLAGSPGVGKSTLLLQLAALLVGHKDASGRPYSDYFQRVAAATTASPGAARDAAATSADAAAASLASREDAAGAAVAYVCGEESAAQIGGRAQRLGIGGMNLWLLNETCVEAVIDKLTAAQAASGGAPPFVALIIDSIQTMWTTAFPASPAGAVTQVREAAIRLLHYAKATGTPAVLVGHVTKGGDVAGPRVLEHIVDAVVFVEHEDSGGNAGYAGGGGGGASAGGAASSMQLSAPVSSAVSGYRILRCLKNRYGSTSEIALLEMGDAGLREADAAGMFLSPEVLRGKADDDGGGKSDGGVAEAESGSAVTVAMEGSRALVVEVQALAYPSGGEYPRHRALGVPADRLTMAAALLGRYPRIRPRAADVLVNVVGGLRLSDTSADLALALALASSFLRRALPPLTVAVGELGLGGEVRPVGALQRRLAAARRMGFRTALVPAAAGSGGGGEQLQQLQQLVAADGWRVVPVRTLTQALEWAFGAAALRGSGGPRGGGGGGVGGGGGGGGGGRVAAAAAGMRAALLQQRGVQSHRQQQQQQQVSPVPAAGAHNDLLHQMQQMQQQQQHWLQNDDSEAGWQQFAEAGADEEGPLVEGAAGAARLDQDGALGGTL